MSKRKSLEEKKEELNSIMKKLEEGIKNVFESDNYKNYLKVMSRFHNYSINNSLLIGTQKPDATLVAGYASWKKHKRQVKKGEKGIRILAPNIYKTKVEQEIEKKDAEGNVIYNNGKPITEKKVVELKNVTFRVVSVFDISQTEGEPLPSLLKVNELDGVVEQKKPIMDVLKKIANVPIEIIKIDSEAKGYFDIKNQKIAIKEGMSDLHTIKTAIHEVAHKLLHDTKTNKKAEKISREQGEVEAESVAFVVSNKLGLDTSDYSFGYIASWSSGKELDELKSSLETIQKTANHIIEEIENELEKFKSLEMPISNEPVDENNKGISKLISNAKNTVAENYNKENIKYKKNIDREIR